MSRIVILFDNPERFVVGTVGQPGERTFYLQARSGNRLISVSLEKEQVNLLADRMSELLDQVAVTEGIQIMNFSPADLDPLDSPIDEEMRVGTIALGWNSITSQVIVETHALTEFLEDVPELEEDSDDGPDVMRVRISGPYARGFCARAKAVVAAGRPNCPLCDNPLDPRGHICPRANGYKRRG
jgi:uncharacterized repeat protein (TIGR03847 family)